MADVATDGETIAFCVTDQAPGNIRLLWLCRRFRHLEPESNNHDDPTYTEQDKAKAEARHIRIRTRVPVFEKSKMWVKNSNWGNFKEQATGNT